MRRPPERVSAQGFRAVSYHRRAIGAVSGVCAAAIETGNLDDPYVEEYVLRIMDEAAQAGKDGRAYVEDRRNKRKR